MQDQLNQLANRLKIIENALAGQSLNFQEKIRDIVIYDIDNSSTRTQIIGAGGGTTPLNPDTYLRIKFRGKTYNIPAYNVT